MTATKNCFRASIVNPHPRHDEEALTCSFPLQQTPNGTVTHSRMSLRALRPLARAAFNARAALPAQRALPAFRPAAFGLSRNLASTSRRLGSGESESRAHVTSQHSAAILLLILHVCSD
jgi:hypothetical protein